jgi:leucyl-tRNA synthetase
MLSDSPPERDINWSLSGINGAWKFTQKFWRTVSNCENIFNVNIQNKPDQFDQISISFRKKIHKYLKLITNSIENFQMNVAVAKIHEMNNELTSFIPDNESQKWAKKEALNILLRIAEPMMPHLAEECWKQIGNSKSIIEVPWPLYDEALITEDEALIIIQINGKKKAEIHVATNMEEKHVYTAALNLKNIQNIITSETTIKKKIFIPNKILNIVI